MSKGKGVSFQLRKESKDKLEEHAVKEVYQNEGNENAVGDTLEEMVREGARSSADTAMAIIQVVSLRWECRRLR